jgi:hypothetical protein
LGHGQLWGRVTVRIRDRLRVSARISVSAILFSARLRISARLRVIARVSVSAMLVSARLRVSTRLRVS